VVVGLVTEPLIYRVCVQSGKDHQGHDGPLPATGAPDDTVPDPTPAPGSAHFPASAAGRLRRTARAAFADITPLRTSPAYRRLWFGHTVSSVGQQMTAVAVGIQVYALTGSTFATGLVGLFALVPLVVFGLYGGAIADTVDRRRLGLAGSVGLAVLSAVLAGHALMGGGQVAVLYGVVALQAGFYAVASPARSAMIPRLVPAEQLPAANALASVSMTLGLTAGPMLGGALIGAWGYQAAYLVDTVAFTATIYAMWRLPPMRPDGRGKGRASVLEGLRFLRGRPNLRMSFLSDLVAMIFGMPRSIFPAIAVGFYAGDARTVGLLTSAPAVGALAGALCSGWVGKVHRHGLAVVCAVVAWGLTIAGFGLVRHLWLGLLLLAAAGCADTVSMIFRNTIMQVAAPDDMRGRLQGIFVVVVAGGPRLGDFESGAVAQLTSPAFSVVSGGLACVAAMLLLIARRPGFVRYDARRPSP
jgi:MFS family permease